MSNILLPALYEPTKQNSRIKGNRILYGIFRIFTHIPMSGKFKTRSITFPTYMLATTPQNTSGCSVSINGPGLIPWIINAPRSTAAITLEGYSKGEQRNKGGAGGGVVCGLGTRHPFDSALAKSFGMLREFFF